MSTPLGGPSADTSTTTTDTGGDTTTTTTTTGDKEFEQYPADHPLVKRLEALKAENKDLKPKAKRLGDIEDAAKTQAERDAEKIANAEREVASVPAKVTEALKTHLVELHQFDKDDAELFLTATEPDLLLKQVNRLLGQPGSKRKRTNVVPKEGDNPSGGESNGDMRDFVRGVFGN